MTEKAVIRKHHKGRLTDTGCQIWRDNLSCNSPDLRTKLGVKWPVKCLYKGCKNDPLRTEKIEEQQEDRTIRILVPDTRVVATVSLATGHVTSLVFLLTLGIRTCTQCTYTQ